MWRHKDAGSEMLNPHKEIVLADIILTTTSEVVESFKQKNNTSKARDHRDVLHQVEFSRVCHDDAHAIRNEKSAVSKACRALRAKYYWAITGHRF